MRRSAPRSCTPPPVGTAMSSPTRSTAICCTRACLRSDRRSSQHAARSTLLEAVDCAIELADGDSAARAVRGAGRGLFSVAGAIDTEQVTALRRTLDLLGPGRTAQRARLLATLSAELLFDDDPRAAERASDEALAIARELADPATIVTVVGLRLVALWRPDTVSERLRLGAELDAIREQAGTQLSGQFLTTMTQYCQAAMEGGEFDLADRLLDWIEETAHLRQPTSVGVIGSSQAIGTYTAKLRLTIHACIAGR